MGIECKVATVINERELVINRGSDDGIDEGMKFKILGSEAEITDPDTGISLGSLTREKIRIQIAEVQPKYSVGRTYQTYVVNVGGSGMGGIGALATLAAGMGPRREVTRVRTLRYKDDASLVPLSEEDSFVKVGDIAIQVNDDSTE